MKYINVTNRIGRIYNFINICNNNKIIFYGSIIYKLENKLLYENFV